MGEIVTRTYAIPLDGGEIMGIERTNQLSLLPDKDLVDLCPPIEPYQVTKNLRDDLHETGHRKCLP